MIRRSGNRFAKKDYTLNCQFSSGGRDGGANLSANALVSAEQRHVPVGGSAGDDVDEAGVVEVAEGADDVAVEVLVVVHHHLIAGDVIVRRDHPARLGQHFLVQLEAVETGQRRRLQLCRQDFAALGRIFDEVSDRLLRAKPDEADIR